MAISRDLINPIDVLLPHLPASLHGLRIVHISDLHIRRHRRRFRRIAADLSLARVDLAFLTGDYIDRSGDEQVGMDVMTEICSNLHARFGIFGVYGNHDTHAVRSLFSDLPVRWLNDDCCQLPDLPLEIVGFDAGLTRRPDALAAVEAMQDVQNDHVRPDHDAPPIRILLSHFPTYLPTAADLGVDLMFSGHTHGGQFRIPGFGPFYNSTDLPAPLTSGILRHRHTQCVVSRGLGEAGELPIRTFCPPHLPVYTLRLGAMPGQPTDRVVNVRPW